jgi:hypothetical protein
MKEKLPCALLVLLITKAAAYFRFLQTDSIMWDRRKLFPLFLAATKAPNPYGGSSAIIVLVISFILVI